MTTTTNDALAAAVAPVAERLIGEGEQVCFTTEAAAESFAKARPKNFKPSWYAINRKKADDEQQRSTEAEVAIFDAIGAFGITAEAFVQDLKAVEADVIHLRLNTPGGEVFDGTAIHNALVEHPAQIVVHVDGVAASAGSFIAMAGDEVRMADNTYMMIHNARGGVLGEADDMRRYADLLEKMNNVIAGMYERKTGKDRAHWRGLMDAETWFTADEAKAQGLADVVEAPTKKPQPAKAAFDFKVYNKIPAPVRELWGIENNTSAATPAATPATETPPETKPETAPEATPRGESSSALTQELPMSEATQTPPAPTPVAAVTPAADIQIRELNTQAVQGYIAQARANGKAEGQQAAVDRLKAIRAVCPDRADMAIDAFINGQSPESVKLAYDAAARERELALQAKQAQDVEIARLQALLATGGSPGVAMAFALTGEGESPALDPKTQAEQEWDHQPARRKGFTSKERYVAVRTAELDGRFHMSAGA